MPDPLPGDYGVVDTHGPYAWGIKLATRREIDDPGGKPASHAFVVESYDPALHDGAIIEAMPGGVRRALLSSRPGARFNHGDPIWAWGQSHYGVSESELRTAVVAAAVATLGRGYNFLDILALALAQRGWDPGWLRRRVQDDGRLICSQQTVVSYLCSSYPLPLFPGSTLPQNVTPESLDDRIADYLRGETVTPA